MSNFDRSVHEALNRLRLALPEPSSPAGSYKPAVVAGELLFLSAQVPYAGGELVYQGRVGAELTLEQGYEAARIAALNTLARIHQDLGSFEPLAEIVRVDGHVASAPGFFDQPRVVDGASDLFNAVLGARSWHARAAFAPPALPMNVSVELAVIVRIFPV